MLALETTLFGALASEKRMGRMVVCVGLILNLKLRCHSSGCSGVREQVRRPQEPDVGVRR